MKILIPISLGELYDKISILEIKLSHMATPEKIANVANEYKELRSVADEYPIDKDLYKQLRNINQSIWDIEDKIRDCEREKIYDTTFVEIARSVYISNDKRSDIKKEINLKYGSVIIEEKSYAKYN